MSSVLVGASRPEQLKQNVAALDILLSAEQRTRLEAAGAPLLNPYFIFDLPRERIFAGYEVQPCQ